MGNWLEEKGCSEQENAGGRTGGWGVGCKMRGEAVESLRAETDILKGEGEQGRAQGNRSRVFVRCRRVEGAEGCGLEAGRRPGAQGYGTKTWISAGPTRKNFSFSRNDTFPLFC